jgi:hypothetical protein
MASMVKKIVSGGQTGADRAALDVAIELRIPHGGWVPKGRKTERGPLPAKYHLKEMATDSYPKRTEQNVMHSDGTLIISHGELTGGSDHTKKTAEKYDKPWLHVDAKKVSVEVAAQIVSAWINGNGIRVLNVAGSRASEDPQIYSIAKKILKAVLQSKHESR